MSPADALPAVAVVDAHTDAERLRGEKDAAILVRSTVMFTVTSVHECRKIRLGLVHIQQLGCCWVVLLTYLCVCQYAQLQLQPVPITHSVQERMRKRSIFMTKAVQKFIVAWTQAHDTEQAAIREALARKALGKEGKKGKNKKAAATDPKDAKVKDAKPKKPAKPPVVSTSALVHARSSVPAKVLLCCNAQNGTPHHDQAATVLAISALLHEHDGNICLGLRREPLAAQLANHGMPSQVSGTLTTLALVALNAG